MMQTEFFNVLNVKCNGCVNTIRNGLLSLPGVEAVEVEIQGGKVEVRGENLSRDALSSKLAALGYPVAG